MHNSWCVNMPGNSGMPGSYRDDDLDVVTFDKKKCIQIRQQNAPDFYLTAESHSSLEQWNEALRRLPIDVRVVTDELGAAQQKLLIANREKRNAQVPVAAGCCCCCSCYCCCCGFYCCSCYCCCCGFYCCCGCCCCCCCPLSTTLSLPPRAAPPFTPTLLLPPFTPTPLSPRVLVPGARPWRVLDPPRPPPRGVWCDTAGGIPSGSKRTLS